MQAERRAGAFCSSVAAALPYLPGLVLAAAHGGAGVLTAPSTLGVADAIAAIAQQRSLRAQPCARADAELPAAPSGLPSAEALGSDPTPVKGLRPAAKRARRPKVPKEPKEPKEPAAAPGGPRKRPRLAPEVAPASVETLIAFDPAPQESDGFPWSPQYALRPGCKTYTIKSEATGARVEVHARYFYIKRFVPDKPDACPSVNFAKHGSVAAAWQAATELAGRGGA